MHESTFPLIKKSDGLELATNGNHGNYADLGCVTSSLHRKRKVNFNIYREMVNFSCLEDVLPYALG